MPFGRSARPNNRSQHNIAVEGAGPAAGSLNLSASGPGAAGAGGAGGAGPGAGTGTGASVSAGLGPLSVPVTAPQAGSSGISLYGAQSGNQVQHTHALQNSHSQQGPGPSHFQQGPSASATASALAQGSSANNLSLHLAASSESFVQDPRALVQSQQPPPHHLYAPASGDPASVEADAHARAHALHQAQLHELQPLNTGTAVSDARVRKAAHEFVDAVARSQSQRNNQVASPIQRNPSYGASYETLSKTLQAESQAQHNYTYQDQQPQAPQGPPVEPRRSTRRLIKNFISGERASKSDQGRPDQSPHHHHSQSQSHSLSHHDNSINNTGGLRPSKRLSNPNPPALRTGSSQVSLDQQSLDWQSQGHQSQQSSLQSNLREFQQPTLRRVPTSQEQSPYSDSDEHSFRQQGGIHVQTQPTPDQQQLGQVVFDPATRQYQFILHSPARSTQNQLQASNNRPAYPGLLGIDQRRNPETISQVSHESPVTEGEQQAHSSTPSTASPAGKFPSQAKDFPLRTSSLQPPTQVQLPQQQQQSPHEESPQRQDMAPPSGGTPQARRTQDADKRDMSGVPPGYRHSQPPSNSINAMASATQGATGQNATFRQSTIQERQQQHFEGEQGRNSPQPSEDPEKAFKDLLTKYKNVKRLYFDGKTQIEQLNGQVEQLQNAVANQRISASRTALDDNEYTTRFNRLNGAINNLSFNIRKDWVSLPVWLEKYVSTDALKTGKQEMTAVGRAVITRWIVDEIFHGCFHPGLNPELSKQLKEVEHNIRRFSYTMNSQEEFEALTSKVVSWRMTTLEGLQHILNSAESATYRQEFTSRATANLTSRLFQHLSDPPPAGVEGSASMIVELAVGITANLPLESRDVAIIYPLPQDAIQPELMDLEKSPLPAIETRPPDSDGEAEARAEDGGKDSSGEKGNSKDRNKSRAGMSATSTLSSLFGSAPAALVPGGNNSRKGSVVSVNQQSSNSAGRKNSSVTDSTTNLALPPKDGNKVRFAGFLAVEVRGRQVLVKAPVWTLG